MSLAYLYIEDYIFPIILLFAVIFIGVTAMIGWAYYRWRRKKRRSNTPTKTPRSRG